MKKRLLALLLAGIMMLSLAACTGGNGGKTAANTEPLTKDDVVDITIISHASWPYDENWKVWDYIEEGVGATLSINAIPASDYLTKYPLMFASPDTLPDVINFMYKPDSDVYTIQGAFKSFDDMADYMPNYSAWVEGLSEEDYERIITIRKGYDGKVYYSPATGREENRGIRAWLYRKDIFAKHGLETPETFEELYEVCKKLKELYPDSFPFAMRSGMSNLAMTGSAWKEWWEPGVYYDYNTEEWKYGATDEILVEMVEWYKRMVDEKLMPADFMTINATTWQELVTTNRAFIFPDYQTRITFFNSIAREGNPDFDLTAFVPPVASEQGVSKVGRYNYEAFGSAICNTGDEQGMANAAKFIDWLYTDEAKELVSWGKEGETYEVRDGKKTYIQDEAGTSVAILYGFTTCGTFTLFDPEATVAGFDKETLAVKDMVAENTLGNFNPTSFLAFNNEESKIIEETATACQTYSEEMISKFILGQTPVSQLDSFVETLNGMGVEKLLGAYKTAYDRVK